jgi:hypothetical protein
MQSKRKRYKCDSLQRTEYSLDPVTSPLLRIYTSPLRNILEPTYNSLQTSHARLQEPHQSHITQYRLRSIPRPKAAKMPSSYPIPNLLLRLQLRQRTNHIAHTIHIQ